MRTITLIIAIALTLISLPTQAGGKRLHHEKWYQEKWCADRGQMEVTMKDGTHADCITKFYAVEVDFADKWAECLSQALRYARLTGLQPACLLIIEAPKDLRYLQNLRADIEHWRLPVVLFHTETGVK